MFLAPPPPPALLPQDTWAEVTSAPKATPPRGRTAHETRLLRACASRDRALDRVATFVAMQRLAGQSVDYESLVAALRREGSPYTWPRARVMRPGPLPDEERTDADSRWVAEARGKGSIRCGVATLEAESGTIVALVTARTNLLLAPVPTRIVRGGTIELRIAGVERSTPMRAVLMSPDGAVRTLPLSRRPGLALASLRLHAEGKHVVQILTGPLRAPTPSLDVWVFVGTRPESPRPSRTPTQESEHSEPRSLLDDINALREAEGLPHLSNHPQLEALATEQALAMMHRGELSHGSPEGDARARLASHGLFPSHLGENLAIGVSLSAGQVALTRSPSHRKNFLDPRFVYAGIGAVRAPNGGLWIAQLFASDDLAPHP